MHWVSPVRKAFYGVFVSVLLAITPLSVPAVNASGLLLNDEQLRWVGERIYHNECASSPQCLVHWNEGEAFPSLGIGHFIWYPAGVNGRFVESFPGFVRYVLEQDEPVPQWLAALNPMDAPWPDRERFVAEAGSAEVESLRRWLGSNQGLQIAYILERAQSSLARVVAAAPEDEQTVMQQRLTALAATPGGSYTLIDYVNFKGEGLTPGETYNGQGWGLLQVLQQMAWHPDKTTLQRFREAAAEVLTRRAANADDPIERDRWLPGWLNRLDTYREPDTVN
ncbi:hypothetical protein [Saccharospirillum impatiens]|uniref:hypothetical protein n=1 Tax=Saccharospirillum impatiens TaxID=169438 RepID=UPI00056A33AA|nr:hypothetical protein [Saccharospirillum impatiens]